MRITAAGITVTCHTTQDVADVCRVLTTHPWTDTEIALYERLVQSGVPSADAMRRVDQTREQRAS